MFVHWHLKVFRSVSVYWKQPLLNLSVCILVCSALMSVQHWFEYMCQNHISSPCLGPLCSLHMWFMWFFWVGYVSVGLKVEMHRPEVSSSWQTKWGVQAVWSDLLRISTWWLQPFSFTFANFASPSAALFRNPASELPFFLCRMGITGFCSFFVLIALRRCGLCAAGTAGYFRHTQHQWCPSFSCVSPLLLIDNRASASSLGCGLSIFCCETSWCSLCG